MPKVTVRKMKAVRWSRILEDIGEYYDADTLVLVNSIHYVVDQARKYEVYFIPGDEPEYIPYTDEYWVSRIMPVGLYTTSLEVANAIAYLMRLDNSKVDEDDLVHAANMSSVIDAAKYLGWQG
jgi:hypothetical protein